MVGHFRTPGASWLWLILRIYVGYEWLTAGWGKITGTKPFDATGFLKGAAAKAVGDHPAVQPWWGSFLRNVAIPYAGLFNFLVQWGEFLVGLALILGFATVFAATMGLVMNFAFMLSGSTSTNPQLAILEILIIVFGGAYAGYLGVDYWFGPRWRQWSGRRRPETGPREPLP